MKVKLLKKLRKESKKLKLIRPKLDTYYSGTYYCGQELLFDEDVIQT